MKITGSIKKETTNRSYGSGSFENVNVDLRITMDDGSDITDLSAGSIVAILRALGELEPKKEKSNE